MTTNKGCNRAGDLMDTVPSVLIAVVTVLTAAVVWRASVLTSEATGADRHGIINTLKAAAAKAENLAYLYQQEADLAQSHVLLRAQIDYLRSRADEFAASADGAAVAASLNSEADALLVADQGTVANTPLASDKRYRRQDNTFDFDARLQDIAAENPDLAALEPGQDFAQADRLDDKGLYLALTVIIFALALFSLTASHGSPGSAKPHSSLEESSISSCPCSPMKLSSGGSETGGLRWPTWFAPVLFENMVWTRYCSVLVQRSVSNSAATALFSSGRTA